MAVTSSEMATLSIFDVAIINFCVKNGACQTSLANEFRKSRKWVYLLGQKTSQDVFPNEDSWLWFNAGIRASELLRRFAPLKPEADTTSAPGCAFWEHSRANREKRRALLARRVENLRPKTPEAVSELEDPALEEEEEEEGEGDDGSAPPDVCQAIIENMRENLSRESRWGWRYNEETIKFAYVVMSYSAICYEWIRKILPLPSRNTLARKFGAVEKALQTKLSRPSDFDDILLGYFDRVPLSCTTEWMQCSLSIDAFSMTVLQKHANGEHRRIEHLDEILRGDVEIEVQKCQTDEIYNEEEEEEEEEEEVAERQIEKRPGTCNNMFIVVLNPFRWELPSVALSVFPWKSGHADSSIVTILLEIVEKLKMYNIHVRVIASDGDSGYACLHKALQGVWDRKRKKDFFRIVNLLATTSSFGLRLGANVFKVSAYPVVDPLHTLKIARSRFLDHIVYLTPSIFLSSDNYRWMDEKWFRDRTQLARMSDFYAISMFSPETFIRSCDKGAFELAIYLWPWTALLLVIRVPFLSRDCRTALLHSCFVLLQYFLNEMLDGAFERKGIYARYRKGCKGVTFFEPGYLVRVIHLVLALYSELLDGGYHLRLAAFGSHVNENMIGRIRVSCHGNHRFEVIMRAVAKSEVRRLLQWELGVDHTVRGRDNVGGTKLGAHAAPELDGLDFASLASEMRQGLEKGMSPSGDVFRQICCFLSAILERKNEISRVYLPNSAANSGIMARLIRFSSRDCQTNVENPRLGDADESFLEDQPVPQQFSEDHGQG